MQKNFKLLTGWLILVLYMQTVSKAQAKDVAAEQLYPDYIIFGIFCGECSGHCATMYRYNMLGNANTFFVDSTDSYFKNGGKINFKTPINDIAKFQIVNKLVQQIPKAFLKTNKLSQTFGCPDCTDGCGIYFELRRTSVVKKFYIDYHTDSLEKEIQLFGELVKETLKKLNRKPQ